MKAKILSRFIILLALPVLTGGIVAAAEGPARRGEAEKGKIDSLILQLRSADFGTREAASKEIVAIGAPALEPLGQAAKGADAEVSRRARDCITVIEHNLKVAALVTLLKDKSPEKRATAADRLWELGHTAKAAVPALVQAIDDPVPHVRERAIVALRRIGPHAKQAIPRLITLLMDKEAGDDLRWDAALALGYIGKDAEPAIPDLLTMLRKEGPHLRNGAANALGMIGKGDGEIVRALIATLRDTDTCVIGSAATALGRIGKEPALCVPALIQVLEGHKAFRGQDDARSGVFGALKGFAQEAHSATPALVEILANPHEKYFFKLRAIEVLEKIGPKANGAIPILKDLRKQSRFREEAKRALESIEGPSK